MTTSEKARVVEKCHSLLTAYQSNTLGKTVMPEDTSPAFTNAQQEERLAYFTLPMALNYQRDSYALWRAALATWEDPVTCDVFDIKLSADMPLESLRLKLLKHRLALQPNKHTTTWHTIARTINEQWGSLTELLSAAGCDYLKLRAIIQSSHKKQFPYLSGPKIFNYWSFIISTYGKVNLKNRKYIEIAPDTHITKCSIILGVITETEASRLSREEISARWRELLSGTNIAPIDMHPPLWFWSRNNFLYKLD